ncbi:uncharacterized protein G2W53_039512 [Senna tora]|uniref:Uncharacterized protein n=1 Tax=Senna tora TaxID=362788 RepID=A0A834W680_9FABA|nr:uncharacterized protein G2W53_039512 [Senna tora]
MTRHTFHAITSPIRASKPLRFPNTTRSDRHDLKHLPSSHEPHSSVKSTRIPKYNVKRSEPYPNIKSTRIPIYNAKRPF